ncbi:Chromo domain-containing protein [Mycena chlorophos]|uniref:Chromo domain-containing protein n=1 Tax=Mycena chlorophos TaxID=658473 RepID=A0A8H6THQ3_MYCCL|nr:Chromo domain-containing protein [Mycena chlorophos]
MASPSGVDAVQIATMVFDMISPLLNANNMVLQELHKEVKDSRQETRACVEFIGSMVALSHKNHAVQMESLMKAHSKRQGDGGEPGSEAFDASGEQTLVADESALDGKSASADFPSYCASRLSTDIEGPRLRDGNEDSPSAGATLPARPPESSRSHSSLFGVSPLATPLRGPLPSSQSIDEDEIQRDLLNGFQSSPAQSPIPLRAGGHIYLSQPQTPPPLQQPDPAVNLLFEGPLSPVPSSDSEEDVPLKQVEVPFIKQEKIAPTGATRKRKRSMATLRPATTTPVTPEAQTKRKRVKSEKTRVIWPEMTIKFKKHNGSFIACDRGILCGRWYHFCCVGIVPKDKRLDEDYVWHCPICIA